MTLLKKHHEVFPVGHNVCRGLSSVEKQWLSVAYTARFISAAVLCPRIARVKYLWSLPIARTVSLPCFYATKGDALLRLVSHKVAKCCIKWFAHMVDTFFFLYGVIRSIGVNFYQGIVQLRVSVADHRVVPESSLSATVPQHLTATHFLHA